MTDPIPSRPSRTAPAEMLDPDHRAGADAGPDHGPSVPQQRAPLDAERVDLDRGHRGCGTRLRTEYWDLARAAWVTGS